MTKNADGTNKIIGPGEKCLVPTDKCFWKDRQDIKNCAVKNTKSYQEGTYCEH